MVLSLLLLHVHGVKNSMTVWCYVLVSLWRQFDSMDSFGRVMGIPQGSADHTFENRYYRLSVCQWSSIFIPVIVSLLIPDLLYPVTKTDVFARIKGQVPHLNSESRPYQSAPGLRFFIYSALFLYQQSLPLSSTYKHALAFLPSLNKSLI